MGFSSGQQLYEELFNSLINDLNKNLERRGIDKFIELVQNNIKREGRD